MTAFDQMNARSWEENHLFGVLIELTYRCNLDCFFCYNDLNLRGTPLTFDEYATFLRDLADMNVLNVILSGGEPLAHPDFFRIGSLARDLGFVTRVKSNGHALRGELARRLRDEVDPYVVEVSLHGARAETHDRQTRVPGSFTRLIENLGVLKELGLRVKVNSTLTAWNENETAEMYAICDALELPLRFDLQVSPRDDGDRSPLAIAPTREGIGKLIDVQNARFAALQVERRPPSAAETKTDMDPMALVLPAAGGGRRSTEPAKYCGAGSAGIAVDPYGNVYPCVQWRRAVANLHDVRIAEIWSTGFDAIRAETEEAARVVRAHPRGKLLNFCPGLAEVLTGSATRVPEEMERMAEIVASTS
jgi:MoaA/NifB/PqqE/SkfB family radical SAM enzyme